MSYGKARELLALALFVAGRTGVTLAEIEDKFECDRRRAQRMLSALRDLLPQLERTIDAERHPRWRLPPATVTAFLAPTSDELASLAKAIEFLEREGALTEATHVKQLEAKARAIIPNTARARIAVDEEALLESLGLAARPGPRPIMNADVDSVIATALKARHRIRIQYAGRADVKPSWRTIEPYGLLLGTRRYLVAQDIKKRGALRYFRVEAIVEATLEEASFEPEASFDLAAQAMRGFGSFENAEEYGPIVWRFSPDAAPHARRYMFHPDQTLEPQEDGALIVRFTASGHLEMAWHLYTWGDKVEVVEPSALREMVKHHRRSDFVALP